MTADEPRDDEYPAGENPFGSAYPSAYQQGMGAFGHVSLPPDELETADVPDTLGDLPAMEPLPDPDALPDPGYPSMAEYQRSAPAASSPFPPPQDGPTAFPQPPAFPPAPAPSAAAGWPPVSPAASGYRDWPPEDEEQPAVAHGDPYQAPREPAEAPPLRGPAVPLSQIQSDTRPSDAPPLAAPLPEELLPADSPPRETAESLTS
ncbi:MAG TPA: hypothetical protein VGY50_00010, partial [Streptosporangiaceae bacterium]|nr:hypothetical protein [Streptosporangiaceae bacterium]